MAEEKSMLAKIKEDIKADNAGWQASSNFLLQLSEEERRNYLGYEPGPDEPSLQEQEEASQANYQSYKAALESGGLQAFGAPSSFDWRNKDGKNWITPVKNQGGCGSCVSFGAVTTVESMVRIGRNDANYAVDLSEAHLFYCHARSEGRNCGNGWWVPPALNAFKDKGVVDEACYPYTAGDQNCTGRCSDWSKRTLRIKGYKELTTIASMKECLSKDGPLVGCFSVYSDFYAYRSGVYRKTSSATYEGGHCIGVVGYSDAESCWICKNSWGAGWGASGFFKIGYGQVGIDNKMWLVSGISDTGWLQGKKVIGLWAINQTRNAFAYISGEGWKKVNNANDTNFYLLLTDLIAAKAAGRNVDLRLVNGEIMEAYVW